MAFMVARKLGDLVARRRLGDPPVRSAAEISATSALMASHRTQGAADHTR